jgi:hypothetical protein
MPDESGESGDLGVVGEDAGRTDAVKVTVRVWTPDGDVDLVMAVLVVGVSGGVRGSVAGVMVRTGTSS